MRACTKKETKGFCRIGFTVGSKRWKQVGVVLRRYKWKTEQAA